jgi:hypothetical protein
MVREEPPVTIGRILALEDELDGPEILAEKASATGEGELCD